MRKLYNNQKYIFVINLVYFLITLLLILLFSLIDVNISWSMQLLILSLPSLIIEMASLILIKYDFYTFQFWYVLLSYLFMFGIPCLHALKAEGYIVWDLYLSFTENLLKKSGFLIIIFIQMAFLGMIIPVKHKLSTFYRNLNPSPDYDNTVLFKTGLIVLIMTIPFRLLTDVQLVNSVKNSHNYFQSTVRSGLQDDIAMLFCPAVIFMIASKKLKKRNSLILTTVVLMYFLIVMIMTGDRRFSVTAIIAIVLCYMKSYGVKLKPGITILCGFLGVIGLNILATIRDIRKGHLVSVKDFFSIYGTGLFDIKNALYQTLGEFGISFYSIVHILKNIPSKVGYQFGKGFWGAIPSFFPVGRWLGDFFSEVTISTYINNLEHNPVGETIIGDFYANFGLFFFIFAFVFGLFISHFFSFNNMRNDKISIARYYSFFYIEINLVRTCFFEVFRPSCYIYILFLIILKFEEGKMRWGNDRC